MRDRIIVAVLLVSLVSFTLLSWQASQGNADSNVPQPSPTQPPNAESQDPPTAPGVHPAVAEMALTPAAYVPLIIRDLTPTPEPTALATIVPSATVTPSLALTSVHGVEMANLFRATDLIEQAGTTWIRRNALLWHDIEPTEGARNWAAAAELEKEMIEAAKRKMRVILIVRGTPTWARKYAQSTCGPVKPDKLGAFAAFMRDAVKRYSAPPYNVTYWEVWNEPDSPVSNLQGQVWGCWGEPSDTYYGAHFYSDMLKVVYPQMKSANADVKIMLGGLLANCDPVNPPSGRNCQPSKWFEGLLINGAGPYFDGVSFHTYDYFYGTTGTYGSDNWHSAWNTTGPLLVVKGRYLKDVMKARGVTGKFIVDTEMAMLCDGCSNSSVYETTKAYYIAQAYGASIAEGFTASIWFSVDGWFGTELLDGNNKPKPSFNAYRVSRAKIGGASFVGDITSADVGITGIKGYKFKRDGTDVWLMWSLNANTRIITLSKKPAVITDALGTSFAPTSTFAVTGTPVYVEWPSVSR